jgi:hypothetical protein
MPNRQTTDVLLAASHDAAFDVVDTSATPGNQTSSVLGTICQYLPRYTESQNAEENNRGI